MPELPEVETVRKSLKKVILNKKIVDVEIKYNKIIKNKTDEDFRKLLIGQKFIDIKRLGKYLIFVLSDYYLISHLRMEGKFLVRRDEAIGKHEHIIFYFTDFNLRYHDTRKFGTMHLYSKNKDIKSLVPLMNVGIEPFDSALTIDYLEKHFSKTTRPVKSTLLDQRIISGLGNIYVDEVLFLAKLNPENPTNTLSRKNISDIIKYSKLVLNKAIELGETTIRTFSSGSEISGRFQNELRIHTKKVCPECGQEVIKIKVGGRGTYHCHRCQPLKRLKKTGD